MPLEFDSYPIPPWGWTSRDDPQISCHIMAAGLKSCILLSSTGKH